ncbi:24-hydroxycholesterol 7-alpha-hydroxylase-like [Mya arenaria]|uniref:24-hydroxycholesterol 7-alpha-hydroxylase-like n=1 Tax=Mya arenaria TaxID=6604 RepID=UPI0022E5847B|nr:24-hydroxycholesterol 7-alpha-hydroxylase-like [Mya arenaria]
MIALFNQSDLWREICTFCLILKDNYIKQLTVCLVLCTIFCIYLRRVKLKLNSPPCCRGWIPFLGCALDFGKSPLTFIGQKKDEHGPLFSVYVAGQTLHILTDQTMYQVFFESPCLDFELTVFDAITKAGLINKDKFIERHSKLYHAVKGTLSPLRLDDVTGAICGKFRKQFDVFIPKEERFELYGMVKRCMYAPIAETLYGDCGFSFDDKQNYLQFIEQFECFDENFELGVQLPSIFSRKWTQARNGLLKRMSEKFFKSTHKDNMTLLDELNSVTGEDAPNYAVLVMLAALSNAVPIVFWAIARILTDERVKQKLYQELNELRSEKPNNDFDLSFEDLKQLPYLRCCVQEALRLQSEGIVGRKIVKDINLLGYDLQKGDLLVLCPYWAHRNEQFFPDPEAFKPERWEGVSFARMSYRQGFIAFGGGRSQCPGRYFAHSVMQKFVASFLLQFHCTPHTPVPAASMMHLVGVQHPTSDFIVSCSKRNL